MAQSLMRLLLFQYDDAGRSKSKRPRSKNDCTVRVFKHVVAVVDGVIKDDHSLDPFLWKSGR